MNLPGDVADAVAPLFEALPLERAMNDLVVTQGAASELQALAQAAVDQPAIAANRPLAAGLWLYVDELDRSHEVSQAIEDATGSFWHGIMHRREGDFGNSHYWFRNTGRHPAMDLVEGYDPHAFIDEVAARHRESPAHLVALQRAEWTALFQWCARQP